MPGEPVQMTPAKQPARSLLHVIYLKQPALLIHCYIYYVWNFRHLYQVLVVADCLIISYTFHWDAFERTITELLIFLNEVI